MAASAKWALAEHHPGVAVGQKAIWGESVPGQQRGSPQLWAVLLLWGWFGHIPAWFLWCPSARLRCPVLLVSGGGAVRKFCCLCAGDRANLGGVGMWGSWRLWAGPGGSCTPGSRTARERFLEAGSCWLAAGFGCHIPWVLFKGSQQPTPSPGTGALGGTSPGDWQRAVGQGLEHLLGQEVVRRGGSLLEWGHRAQGLGL